MTALTDGSRRRLVYKAIFAPGLARIAGDAAVQPRAFGTEVEPDNEYCPIRPGCHGVQTLTCSARGIVHNRTLAPRVSTVFGTPGVDCAVLPIDGGDDESSPAEGDPRS